MAAGRAAWMAARRPLNYADSGWGDWPWRDLDGVKPGSAALVGVG